MITDINQLDFNKKYSYADYLTWRFSERVELIMGRIFKMTPAPRTDHQQISTIISSSLFYFLKGNQCKVFAAPFDVRLPNEKGESGLKSDNVVQPDISVICDPAKIDDKGCVGAPDLIVEIVSKSSVKKDLHEKYDLYERHGVREYWIVAPFEMTLSIFVLGEKGHYIPSKPLTLGDTARSTVISGFAIDLDELFRDMAHEPVEEYEKSIKRI
jgi:Uma2 family endonuclease